MNYHLQIEVYLSAQEALTLIDVDDLNIHINNPLKGWIKKQNIINEITQEEKFVNLAHSITQVILTHPNYPLIKTSREVDYHLCFFPLITFYHKKEITTYRAAISVENEQRVVFIKKLFFSEKDYEQMKDYIFINQEKEKFDKAIKELNNVKAIKMKL